MTSNSFPVGGRRTWLGLTVLVGALGAVEVSVVAFIAHAFLPAVIAWTLDALGVVILVLTGVLIASVTWRRHRMTDSELTLVLGHLAQARIPLHLVRVRRLWQRRPVTCVEASDESGEIAAALTQQQSR